jgi:hypothetical protein
LDGTQVQLESQFGNTKGRVAPSEFGYFWQYWMNHDRTDDLSQADLDAINWGGLRKELYASAGIFQKPLMLKNVVYHDYKIPRLAEEFPNSKFIHISRNAEFVVQSILESRVKRYGDRKHWWSIRPKNLDELKQMSPVNQVVQQYQYTQERIETDISGLHENRQFQLRYEDLAERTEEKMKEIASFLGMEAQIPNDYAVKSTNEWRLDEEEQKSIESSLKEVLN